MEKVDKIWGYEKIIVNNELYCGKFLHLKKNCHSSIHFHKIKDETFYILQGQVKIEFKYPAGNVLQHPDWITQILNKGKSIRFTPNTQHRFTGLEDSIIIEFSTKDFSTDSYRLQDSGCE